MGRHTTQVLPARRTPPRREGELFESRKEQQWPPHDTFLEADLEEDRGETMSQAETGRGTRGPRDRH